MRSKGLVMVMMVMVMVMMLRRRRLRHLSVKAKGLVKSFEEPMANTEAAVRPSLATLTRINSIFPSVLGQEISYH